MMFIVLFHFLGRNYNLFGIKTETAIWDEYLLAKLLVHATGQLGVPGFVFISGYFGLKFNTYRFVDMIVQCFVYSFLFYLVIAPVLGIFGLRAVTLSLFFLSGWWFMWSYVILYFISPGLNNMIDGITKNKFMLLLVILFFISIGLWTYNAAATNIFILIEIYFIARFTKIHLNSVIKSKAWVLLLLSTVLFYGTVAIGYFRHNLGIMAYVNSYYNPIIITLVGSLIVVFEKIKFSSKIVNWISPNILAVYLITENFYGVKLFKDWFYLDQEYPILKFVGIAFALTILCVLIEKIRLGIMDKLEKRWSMKLENWFNQV